MPHLLFKRGRRARHTHNRRTSSPPPLPTPMPATNSVAVHVVERGRTLAHLSRGARPSGEIAILDVIAPPPIPLRLGLAISIHTVTRWRNGDGTLSEEYAAAPMGVEGRIVGIRAMELAVTEFIVSNDDLHSPIESAYLSIRHIHGVTVDLGIWRTILRTLMLPTLQHTRHVPLETEAVIVPRSIAINSGRPRYACDGTDGPDESDEED